MRSLAKRAEARFQGAADFRNALLNALGTAPAPMAGAQPFGSQDATRIIGAPVVSAPVPGVAPRETRLAGQASTGSQADQIKQTRLAAEAGAPVAYGGGQSAPVYYPAPAPPAGKSNAKLFIGIAAVLFIMIAGSAVVLLTVGKQQTPPPPVAPAPVQSSSPPTAPSSGAGEGQPSIPAQAPPQSIPQVELARPGSDSLSSGAAPARENANAGKAAAAKTARKETSAEAAARKEKERKAAEARRLLNQ
jgi:hypothetical protein